MEQNKNKLKEDMSKMADAEYYAGLESLIKKDVIASKYFDPSEIKYPLMEKSSDTLNYGGINIPANKNFQDVSSELKKRGMSSLLTSESTFKDNVKSGKTAIAIFQNPVANANDINKMRVILHEVRHKAFEDPINKEFLKLNRLNEEVLNRFLDYKIFPELRTVIKNELDSQYEKGFNGLKSIYQPAADNFLKYFNKNSKSLLNK
jgi:hypothetical protein